MFQLFVCVQVYPVEWLWCTHVLTFFFVTQIMQWYAAVLHIQGKKRNVRMYFDITIVCNIFSWFVESSEGWVTCCHTICDLMPWEINNSLNKLFFRGTKKERVSNHNNTISQQAEKGIQCEHTSSRYSCFGISWWVIIANAAWLDSKAEKTRGSASTASDWRYPSTC